MELWKIVLFVTGLLSINNMVNACPKRAELQTFLIPTEVFDERITKAVRPVLRLVFNLGDLDTEKYTYHIHVSDKVTKIVIYLSNLSSEELATLHKRVDELIFEKFYIIDWDVKKSIRKLLDSIDTQLKDWPFNGALYLTMKKKDSVALSIAAGPDRPQSSHRLFGPFARILTLEEQMVGIDVPAHNSISVV